LLFIEIIAKAIHCSLDEPPPPLVVYAPTIAAAIALTVTVIIAVTNAVVTVVVAISTAVAAEGNDNGGIITSLGWLWVVA
jgi:hypothetical protein